MEITSERNDMAEETFRLKKRKMLTLVGELFQTFDVDQGHTLDDAEVPVMLKALVKHQDKLDKVRIPFVRLPLSVCTVVLCVDLCLLLRASLATILRVPSLVST